MVFAKFFRSGPDAQEAVAIRLYTSVVEKARDPAFYSGLGVPDTMNGRFDLMVIHAMLVLRRLRGGGAAADATGKAMLELLFRDMDQSLREMGVGDMGVGRHIKKMAKAFFGRAEAYEAGLDGDGALLTAALRENLYRHGAVNDEQIARMSTYVQRAAAHIGAQDVTVLAGGVADFAVPVLETTHAA